MMSTPALKTDQELLSQPQLSARSQLPLTEIDNLAKARGAGREIGPLNHLIELLVAWTFLTVRMLH